MDRGAFKGDYKLLGPNSKKSDRDAARARGDAIVYTLYNIATDPTEQHDLAASMPEKVEELKASVERGKPFLPRICSRTRSMR